MKSYGLKAIKNQYGGGTITFRTSETDIYEKVADYINVLIDAENYRRTLHRVDFYDKPEEDKE